MVEKELRKLREKMEGVVLKLEEVLRTIRSQGSFTELLENIAVNYFGNPTPLKQMAHIGNLSMNEAAIDPWDKNALGDIELALRNSDHELSIINDGRRIIAKFPPLTSENRENLVKKLGQYAEEAKVTLRSLRGEVWEEIQTLERQSKVTEDDKYDFKRDLDKMISEFNQKIDKLTEEKKKQIMG